LDIDKYNIKGDDRGYLNLASFVLAYAKMTIMEVIRLDTFLSYFLVFIPLFFNLIAIYS